MKRKHIHTRTVSALPPEAFLDDLILDNIDDDDIKTNNDPTTTTTKPKKKVFRYDQWGNKIENSAARVIMLGTEYTGKTTIFNQLRNFCGNHPISQDELIKCKALCIKHLILVAKQLSAKCIQLRMKNNANININTDNENLIVKYAASLRINNNINLNNSFNHNNNNNNNIINEHNMSLTQLYKLKKDLKAIFQDAGIIQTFQMCHYDGTLIENAQYFLSKLYKYFDVSYIPSFQDYCNIYHNTSNLIIDENINSNSSSSLWDISFTDISGHRSQRTLWSSILSSSYTCCLYVISLNDYNNYNKSPLYLNKLIESFELLHSLITLNEFNKNISNLILIFNKKDIFETKLTSHSVSFIDNFPIYLTERFYYSNRNIIYSDSIYTAENNNLNTIKNKNHLLGLKFDKSKEFDPNYCIDFLKQEIRQILPPNTQKKLQIYITSSIAPDFKYVIQTLIQEIVHMEQMAKTQKML